MQVYLSGPITGCSYRGATDWRTALTETLHLSGHRVLNPMRGKDYLLGCRKLSPLGEPDHELSTVHAIVSRDSNDVLRCDVMLVNFLGATQVSIGSVFELAWGWLQHKYVIVVMEAENPHRHGFVEQCASIVTDSLDEALHYLEVFAEV